MAVHDWTRVEAGIFHAFHHSWIEEISRALNGGLLPPDYYALAEQQAAGFGPDVLTLQVDAPDSGMFRAPDASTTSTLARPHARFMAQTEGEFYRRKKSSIVVRHVSDDRIVAMVEIVSPGNKQASQAFHAFIKKACELLEQKIHLLIIDLFPPTRRDPNGIHAAIWNELADQDFLLPPDKPLTLAAYEAGAVITTFVESIAVGDELPPMPLILEPDGAVYLPLEETYQRAFAAVPRRWQTVLQPDRS
jgi:hypothetical protein